MNPAYFGDSYDLVKRFFCREFRSIGYAVLADPMLTGTWNGAEKEFYHLIGAQPLGAEQQIGKRTALFLDPDTGINEKGSKQHASFDRLADESKNYDVVFAFDQSFSRQKKPESVMHQKLEELRKRGCYGMYYDSHARFVFVTNMNKSDKLDEIHDHFRSVGLPESRLLRLLRSDA